MNKKSNPWVSLVALLLLILIIVMTCTGCRVVTEAEKPEELQSRFTVEFANNGCRIITDHETGVQYLAYTMGNGTGLTKLEGAEDGKQTTD